MNCNLTEEEKNELRALLTMRVGEILREQEGAPHSNQQALDQEMDLINDIFDKLFPEDAAPITPRTNTSRNNVSVSGNPPQSFSSIYNNGIGIGHINTQLPNGNSNSSRSTPTPPPYEPMPIPGGGRRRKTRKSRKNRKGSRKN